MSPRSPVTPCELRLYTRALGLRFVKKTVNFDDPGTYHFYYGDEAGNPGTILTFFPWENAAPGRGGVGQTQQTAFRVPARSARLLDPPLHREGHCA
jgi:catechol 2,3-dioxygenase-like lactoylglutathione lyase family enzyme